MVLTLVVPYFCASLFKNNACSRITRSSSSLRFPDIEEAKTLIKRFRRDGDTSDDSVERYLPEWEYVCLNRHEQPRILALSHSMHRVSLSVGARGEDYHIFPSHKEEACDDTVQFEATRCYCVRRSKLR
jgi:hypothetical protein